MTCTIAWLALHLAVSPAGPWQAAPQADLAEKVAQAATLTVEELPAPIRSIRTGMLLRAPNPDGRTWDLLQIYFRHYGGPNSIVILDTARGTVRQVLVPLKPIRYQFHLCPSVVAPNGKLYISVLALVRGQPQRVCIYDPATNELKIDALDMPDELRGETHPMVLGTNGKIYCAGQHPSKAAGACEIDPSTNRVTAYGAIGPSHAPSSCWGYSAGADERWIYIASGKVPWYLVAFDRRSRTSKVLATTERVGGYVGVSQGRFGCTAGVTSPVGSPGKRVDYWLHEGKAVVRAHRSDPPPWPEPKDAAPLVKLPPPAEVLTAGRDADANGQAEFWTRTPEAARAAAAAPPGAASLGPLGWKRLAYRLPTYPQTIYRLRELPDGRIFGSAGSYEGCFVHDPKTGASRHLGKIALSHYATAIHAGKVYLSGYPSSPVYAYDPSRAWTAGTRISAMVAMKETDRRSNPRRLARLAKAGTHKMFAACVGADGCVYFGGRWVRNGSGGGLGWWNPKTATAGGLWRPFSNYQINFMAAVDGGKTLVISAHRVTDTVLRKPKPDQGALLLFDVASRKVTGRIEPVARAKGPGPIAAVGAGRILGWTEDPADAKRSILYGADVRTRRVAFRKTIPFALPIGIGSNQREAWDYRLGPDGCVWTFLPGRVLVRIDPADATVRVVGKVSPPGRIAFAGEYIYLSGTTALRRVRIGLGAGQSGAS